MTQERLTRQELSWLLAQEARGAAKALRDGVTQLKQPRAVEVREAAPPVETTLDVLDDAIGMLSELQAGAQVRGRRGRIDLAALLCEIAPNARIVMEPGAGTEVFGEEGDLSRMLHLLVSQTHSNAADTAITAAPEVQIRRQDEWVKVSVALGPDTSATGDMEGRWLNRMAVRHGGRVELEGGMQSILLPADGASEKREVMELRKELEQAQQLGEAYARELAAVFAAGEAPVEQESAPPSAASERLDVLIGATAAQTRLLRAWLEGLRADAAAASSELGEGSALAQSLGRRVSAGYELLGELRRIAECPRNETPRSVDVAALAHQVTTAAEARAARHGVELMLEVSEGLELTTRRSAFEVFLRALLDHAIAATPREGRVLLRLGRADDGVMLAVEDGGPAVPEAARADLLAHRLDPASLGRPSAPALLVASTLALHLGAALALREASGRTETYARIPRS